MTPNRKCSQTTFTHNYLPFSKLKQLLLSVTELMMNILIFHIHFSYTCLAYKVLNHFLIAALLSTCLYCLPIYEPFFLLNNTLTNTPILYTLFFSYLPSKIWTESSFVFTLGSWALPKRNLLLQRLVQLYIHSFKCSWALQYLLLNLIVVLGHVPLSSLSATIPYLHYC